MIRHFPLRSAHSSLRVGDVLLSIVILATYPSKAQAQNGPVWIAFDGSPAGTPASVVLDAGASDPSTTVVDVTVSGLWVSTRVGPDNVTYHDVVVPGLPSLSQMGAPRLPTARFLVGVLTGADSTALAGYQSLQAVILPGIHAWPEPIEPELHEGSPGQFVRDDAIYSSNGLWPPDPTSAFPAGNLPGEIPCAEVALNLIRWDPATDLLQVQVHSRWLISHPGSPPSPGDPIPKTLASLASTALLNWPVISPYLPVDVTRYAGYFLFVRPPTFRPDLEPLITQKLARGFHVSEVSTDTTGADSLRILAAIRNWYRGTPRKADHFCLLVADVDSIPTSASPPLFGNPGGVFTDDVYGSMDGLNLDKEVFVGRLPVDTKLDVRDVVRRILKYEDTPPPYSHFDKVLLMAHQADLDGTTSPISSFHETVRTASYLVPPGFVTLYGASPSATNAALISELNAGAGVLSYIGHSSSGGYTSWNAAGEIFYSGTLTGLTNAPKTPLVWSFSCTTGFINGNDCMGETWLNVGANGAVGFYGATALVDAYAAGTLDQVLFDEVYNKGDIVQGYTYAAGERRLELDRKNGDSWKYILLGDPQMAIRRRDPTVAYTLAPVIHHFCPDPGCDELLVAVRGASDAPIPGALVGAWKPGWSASGAALSALQGELNDNRYTGQDGVAHIPTGPLTDGMLYYTVQLDDGTARLDSVWVRDGEISGVPVGSEIPAKLFLRVSPPVTSRAATFSFSSTVSPRAILRLFTVSGRLIRTIPLSPGVTSVTWNGTDEIGAMVPAGVYWARLETGQAVRTCRLIVVK